MKSPALLSRAWARRDVFAEFVKREVSGRYSGSHLGMAWSLFNPMLMLGVYTLAFREFLGMRWPNFDTRADFSLMIFCGLIVHSLFAEILVRAPISIVGNTNLVKKVVFPLVILPCVTVAGSLFNTALSIAVLLVFMLITRHALSANVLYLPLVFAPYMLMLCGISWLLASLGVFMRDIVQVSGVIATIFMFLSPVFYPASSLKPAYRGLMDFNPLTLIIEQTRKLVMFGESPDWSALATYAVVAAAVMAFGYWWFQRTRDGFADVL